MANQKHGEMNWNDSSFKESGSSSKKEYMKLKPGSNPIRILTAPYQYNQHRYKFEGDKTYGHRINCSKKLGACIVCDEANDKPKRRWYLGVIDRNTNSYKILDVGWSVLSDIQTYASDEDWGDPTEYDFDIVVNPNGGPQNYYKAVAKPKRPLSASDLLHKEKVDLDYLAQRCMPPEPASVEEKFNELKAEFSAPASKNDAPVKFAEDNDFPNADEQELPF